MDNVDINKIDMYLYDYIQEGNISLGEYRRHGISDIYYGTSSSIEEQKATINGYLSRVLPTFKNGLSNKRLHLIIYRKMGEQLTYINDGFELFDSLNKFKFKNSNVRCRLSFNSNGDPSDLYRVEHIYIKESHPIFDKISYLSDNSLDTYFNIVNIPNSIKKVNQSSYYITDKQYVYDEVKKILKEIDYENLVDNFTDIEDMKDTIKNKYTSHNFPYSHHNIVISDDIEINLQYLINVNVPSKYNYNIIPRIEPGAKYNNKYTQFHILETLYQLRRNSEKFGINFNDFEFYFKYMTCSLPINTTEIYIYYNDYVKEHIKDYILNTEYSMEFHNDIYNFGVVYDDDEVEEANELNIYSLNKKHTSIPRVNLSRLLTMNLFDYQKDNVSWMIDMETSESRKLFKTTNKFLENTLKIHFSKNSTNKIIQQYKYNIPDYIYTISGEDSEDIYYRVNEINSFSIYTPELHYNQERSSRILSYYDEEKNVSDVYCNSKKSGKLKDFSKTFKNGTFKVKGGILSDDVGLGKTLSTISFLVASKDIDRSRIESGEADLGTMIILPNRLISQWMFEINKYLVNKDYLKVAKIGTITDYKKLFGLNPDMDKLKEYDIILVANTLFGNDKLLDNYIRKDNRNIFNINWNRIIIDEAHEVLVAPYVYNINFAKKNKKYYVDTYSYYSYHSTIKNNYLMYHNKGKKSLLPKKKRINNYNIIFNLKSNYRWCLTATPLMYDDSNMLSYLYWLIDWNINIDFSKEDNIYNLEVDARDYTKRYNPYYCDAIMNIIRGNINNQDLNNFASKFISKNHKSQIQENLGIPLISEEVIFLNLSVIEKEIYEYYKTISNSHYANRYGVYRRDNSILFKLCTNLLILGNNIFRNYNRTGEISKDIDNMEIESLSDVNKKFIDKLDEEIDDLTIKLNIAVSGKDEIIKYKPIIQDIHNLFSNYKKKQYLDFVKYIYKNYFNLEINDSALLRGFNSSWSREGGIIGNVLSEATYKANNFGRSIHKNMKQYFYDLINKLDTVNINSIISNHILEECYSYISNIIYLEKNDAAKMYWFANWFKYNTTNFNNNLKAKNDSIKTIKYNLERYENQKKIMTEGDFLNEKINEPCIVCWCDFEDDTDIIITKCRHIMCGECFKHMMESSHGKITCPQCRADITAYDISKTKKVNVVEVEEEEIEVEETPYYKT